MGLNKKKISRGEIRAAKAVGLAFTLWVVLVIGYGVVTGVFFNNLLGSSTIQTVTKKNTTYRLENGDGGAPVIADTSEIIEENGPNYTSFHVSFMASAMEDAIFFVIIGALTYFLAFRRPEDESIDNKISFLFNDDSLDAKNYAKKAIERLACYSTGSFINIRIDEYSPKLDAYKVSTEWEFNLHNMYSNKAYKDDDEFHVELEMDDIDIKESGGVYGQIHKIRTVINNGGHPTTTHFLDELESISEKSCRKEVRLEIPEGDKAIYEVNFWFWCKAGEPYHQWVRRYTKELKITLGNYCGEEVKVSGHQGGEQLLSSGKTLKIHDGSATPESKMWFAMHKNQDVMVD